MSDRLFPIFDIFPELKEKVPIYRIRKKITPVQQLQSLGSGNLWIKRDDLTSEVYGGNKVRKLEFILADVLKQDKRRVVTMGGLGTNHGLATAIFAGKLGLKTTLILFPQPVTSHVLRNLSLFYEYNAELVHTTGLLSAALQFYLIQRLKKRKSYFLYAGGSTPLGTLGYVNAVFELKEQIEAGDMPLPDKIFCPLGSNGTLAGIALGVHFSGLQSEVIGVRVTKDKLGPIPLATKNTVLTLMRKTGKLIDRTLDTGKLSPPEIIQEYFGSGYGHPTSEGLQALDLMREKEGIQLDLTYTAKTFAAVLNESKKADNKDLTILYWHTFNSAEINGRLSSFDYKNLPVQFHRYFKEVADII